jgi:exonuclease SbcD
LKFLHTADLHLGKVFYEHSLIEDQRYMLETLGEILKDPSYDALLIAGDVYDRSIPPPDAVSLFGPFLGKLKKERPDIAVFLISGNHDSASRLAFGRELFASLGVHFATNSEGADTPVLAGKDTEKTAFFLLPFLNPGSLRAELTGGEDAEPLRSQARLAAEAAARLENARLRALEGGARHTVLLAHLFAAGATGSVSERTFLGGAELIDVNLFSGFDYVALGHLHKAQKAGTNAFYAGSPLAYSFSEAQQQKFFLSVTLEAGREPHIEHIPVTPLRKLSSIKGAFPFFSQEEINDEIKPVQYDYLEIILTDKAPVEGAMARLRQRFPFVLHIDQDEAIHNQFLANSPGPVETAENTIARNLVDEFRDFLTEINGEADSEELALFEALLAAAEAEDQK